MIPRVQLIDLSSRLGPYSLAQLGIPSPEAHNAWCGLRTPGAEHGPLLDWHRCPTAADLPAPDPGAAELWLLLGPGSLPRLDRWLAQRASAAARVPVRAFYTPNAVLEKMRLADQPTDAGIVAVGLPDSDPQTLWFLLCEQLAQLPQPDPGAAATAPSPSAPDSNRRPPVPSNIQEPLQALLSTEGALGVALADYTSGMCLAKVGGGVDLDLAAAGNAEVIRAKLKTMDMLGIRRGIEDILITLAQQYHLIRLLPNHPGLFLYLVLDKSRSNLALARYRLKDIERALQV